MNRNEDAVSPVIGVILMVAITVILAAVIAAFVFGMGPTDQAPQASMRATDVDGNAVYVSHQGGESLDLSETSITIKQGTNVTKYNPLNDNSTVFFEAGDQLVLYTTKSNATLNNGNLTGIGTDSFSVVTGSSNDVVVTISDIPSGQLIGEMSYNV